jgi:GntR family transcriptional regulator, rspAB operon transcriptional repressor
VSTLQPIALRAETLSEQVYATLRDAVISSRLPPGERLTEAGLAKQLAVSKTPVREALLRLEHVGLVESDGRRAYVVEPSAEAIREAYELRMALETEAALRATSRVSEDALREIAARAEESSEAAGRGDQLAFADLDRRFHLAIAAGAHNRRLLLALEDALDLVSALRSRDAPVDANPEYAAHHMAIARAMADRDEARVRARLREHLAAVRDLVLEAFPS